MEGTVVDSVASVGEDIARDSDVNPNQMARGIIALKVLNKGI
jgi:hypothetical protein